MRKQRRQKAIFSAIAGIGAELSSEQPILAAFPPPAAPEEIHLPAEQKPAVPEMVPGPSTGAEAPQMLILPDQGSTLPLMPESVALPGEESLAPQAVAELADTPIQAAEAEIPVILEPPEPEPRLEPVSTDLPSQAGQEEILWPPEPQPVGPENIPAPSLEAEAPQMAILPDQGSTLPLTPESVALPVEESLAPEAVTELAEIPIQAAEAEIPMVPEPAEPVTAIEESPRRFTGSLKIGVESLDFGRVLVGSFADLSLTVANESEDPRILTDLGGVPDAGFSLFSPPSLPLTLGPAGFQVFTVRFCPDSVGKKTARLSLLLHGQTGSQPEVRLNGEAARAITSPHGLYYSPVFNSLDMAFVYIPPGSFVMGSPEDEPGRNTDEKQYEVTLSRGFYLQSTTVTQRQWQAVMGINPATSSAGGDYPMGKVSWHECQIFIQKLNLLGEGVYRLPTEAEWEYACRAGGPAALGDRELTALFREHDPFLDAVAWYSGNSEKQSHPVGLKNPNAWDIYDMHGNVMEWCQDWYGEYPTGAATDPTGPPTGADRVIRGGSWFSSAKNCRAACRAKLAPTSKSHYLGLRLVKEIDSP